MNQGTFRFKLGLMNYSQDDIKAITSVARKIASIMDKLSEGDARILAAFIDPTLDGYVLAEWDKRNIIQEAIEDTVKEKTDKGYWLENMYEAADALSYRK